MKTTICQEVEFEISLGANELQALIAEQWGAVDGEGYPVKEKVINVVTLLRELSDDQISDFHPKTLLRMAELLEEQAIRFKALGGNAV